MYISTMEQKELISKIKSITWEKWLERKLDPFVVFLIMRGATSESFYKIGLMGGFPGVVYQPNYWYNNKDMNRRAYEIAGRILEKKDIFLISRDCEKVYREGKKEILSLISANMKIMDKFRKVYDVLVKVSVYIW